MGLSQLKDFIRRWLDRPGAPDHDERPPWDFDDPVPSGREAHVVEYVVDNRVFLLGLDELFRAAMKKHESGELLACARFAAAALKVSPSHVPIEGYYAEQPALTAYFQLMRALQEVPLARAPVVESLPQFQRLLEVTSSPIFGQPIREHLLPRGRDPLSAALNAERSLEAWTVPLLTAKAATLARETDDCSLVGLASRAEDPVVLAALRETVVLYAETLTLGASPQRPQFVWRVDPELCAAAQRFVDTFNNLFGRELPPPIARYAHVFGSAAKIFQILGRCVRVGQTDELPARYYHWAVDIGVDGKFAVNDFWADEIWTTARYRQNRARPGAVLPKN
jgi:hypothetical protein